MSYGRHRRPGAGGTTDGPVQLRRVAPGKRTLTSQLPPVQGRAPSPGQVGPAESLLCPPSGAPSLGSFMPPLDDIRASLIPEGGQVQARTAVQREDAGNAAPAKPGQSMPLVRERAAQGVAGPGGALPHREPIQAAFGRHDAAGITAHVGGAAAEASADIGAEAYATGDHVAFARPPDLHTAAHEAAHVVQQRGGVQLKGGVGRAGDAYEEHADAVADRVVRGEGAEALLDQMAGGTPGSGVQMRGAKGDDQAAGVDASKTPTGETRVEPGGIDPPQAGINKTGFIDNSDGANIRTSPDETGGRALTSQPLPPATRVFVSGQHKDAAQWWYVTAFLPDVVVRGYVQGFRVNTDLPEPTAKLYQVKGGENAEGLARQEFSASVRDGHDLRYYENVLLVVNKERGRAGITGTFQAPNILGGGDNNIQLVSGHRIWLVSPAYARTLEGVVPDGSLTNGAVAKARRFAGHLLDILKSVAESRNHLDEVAGEFAQAIRDHMAEIVGIISAFILAESASAFLAATPTGVGQIAAVVIQLGLAAFGAAGMVEAGVQALGHADRWLTLAWTAEGKEAQIAAASKDFLRMVVALAMAALARSGVKGNMGRAAALADSMPTMLPALAVAGGGEVGAGRAGAIATTGIPGPAGPFGTAAAMTMKDEGESGGSSKKDEGDKQSGTKDLADEPAVKDAAEQAGRKHVHEGGVVTDPKSPYLGKWDGGGIHDWEALEKVCARDGYRIKKVVEDPSSGVRRATVERVGVDPRTKLPVTGTVTKTIYPKRLTPAQIDAAGESAFEAALHKQSGTKLDPVGTKIKRDGSPADGFFEATVKAGDPPRDLRIQGWYSQTPKGEKVITSHAPVYEKTWPTVEPKDY